MLPTMGTHGLYMPSFIAPMHKTLEMSNEFMESMHSLGSTFDETSSSPFSRYQGLGPLARHFVRPPGFGLSSQSVPTFTSSSVAINGLQNCDWRLQDAFIWRFQDATFSVQVFYATLTFTTVTVVLVLPWIMPMKTREMCSKWNLYMSASVPAEVHNMTPIFVLRDSLHVTGCVYITSWCLLQLLLQRPINAMPLLLLNVQILAYMLAFSSCGSHHKQWVEITALYNLGMAGHFALGNSNTLATIDMAGAFIGISSHSTFLSGVLMFLITYACPMLFFFSLVVYISIKVRICPVVTGDENSGEILKKEVNEKLKSLSAPIVGLILQRSRIVTDNDGHYASSTAYLYPLTDGDTRQGLNNLQATMDSSLTGSGKTFTMQPLPLRAANDLVRQLHRPVYRNQKFKLWLAGFSRGIQEMHRKASLVLEDAVRNIYTVVAFCARNKVMELYRLQLKKIFKQSFLHGMGIGFAFGFSQFLLFACNALLLWYTAICIRNGYINPSTALREYMVFSFATFALVEPFGLAPYILKRRKSLISVFDIIDREPKIDPDDNKALKPPNVYGSIELKKISIFVIHHVLKC
ncbi:hypothetical protein KIW84_057950 [Lathyrus oleraceus]|uniref:ABC transmembrane type-1 domain-containing protein n=1 Tax=Pisum sativum TaxID=3888 RepID=A0A9D5AIT3_PEA|nr:hypothetical protein KIW84_057950 [Pisum sativum]